ncbi:MAG: cell division protein ZapA, partial [Pyrinomonadaceae bacterium]|nr:cell division protein ZapA [Pyrinomonadaceae bacterium]
MSSDAPKPSFKSVEVNIFNQVYSLRTNREVEHIKRIAGLVDERMRLISAHTTAHDLAKIAVFAALNIADEMSDTRDHNER